jgi:putative nucleotidyltransferase with HDIG domain
VFRKILQARSGEGSMMMDKTVYLDVLDRYIKNKKRKQHSISTALFMEKYSGMFGLDTGMSYIAGLLHDIGKSFDERQIIDLSVSFEKRKIDRIAYFDFKMKHPFLLHGVASAETLLREKVISEKNLVLAIAHHTTGGVDIPLLAKYTFLSDFCEPMRDMKESGIVRKMLIKKNDFNRAYYLTYHYLIESLLKRNMEICLESIDGYNESLVSFMETSI